MNGLIVAFYYDGAYKSERYRVLFDFFLIQARRWAHAFDRLYLVDSGWKLSDDDEDHLNNLFRSARVLRRRPMAHWDNVRYALDIAAADGVLTVGLIDSDTLIYNIAPIVDGLARIDADTCDVVAITDGSGGYRISESFPQFAANEKRAERRRIAPYLCLARREHLDGLNFAPLCVTKYGGNWMDSFGCATLEIMRRGARLEEFEDDRNSLYLLEDGTIYRGINLDSPSYEWSAPDRVKSPGYYHVRNFGAAVRWLDACYLDRRTFEHEMKTTPRTETHRLLGWYWMLSAISRPDGNCFPADMVGVLEYLDISDATWSEYMHTWLECHPWLRLF